MSGGVFVIGVEAFGEVYDLEEVSIFAEEFGSGGKFVGREEGIFAVVFKFFNTGDSGAEFGLGGLGGFDDICLGCFDCKNVVRHNKTATKSQKPGAKDSDDFHDKLL